jgi:hypothetical protein
MASKKKKAEPKAPATPDPSQMQSVGASEAATEGKTQRKVIELPGMVGDGVAKPEIPALDDAVLDYVKERDKRIEHGVKEKTNKKLILALMDKHNIGSYEVDDMVVVRKPKDETASIKVMAAADYTGDPANPTDDGDDD